MELRSLVGLGDVGDPVIISLSLLSASLLPTTRPSLAPSGWELKEWEKLWGCQKATPIKCDVHINFFMRALHTQFPELK